MRDLEAGALEGGRVDGVAVVLAGHLYVSGGQLAHGVVAAAVAELELVGLRAVGEGYHLVTQADAHDGVAAFQRAHGLHDLRHVLRVAGAVGQQYAVRSHEGYLLGAGVVGHDRDVAAAGVERLDHAQLDAAVYGHDGVLVVGRARVPALGAAHAADLVVGQLGGVQPLQRGLQGQSRVAQQRLLAAGVAYLAREAAGVYARQAGDAVLLHQLGKGLGIAEVGRVVVVVAHQQRADGRRLGLIVLVGDAVVAYDGIGHAHRLVGVRGVGNYLLIPGHGGVEHHLADALRVGAEALAAVLAPG